MMRNILNNISNLFFNGVMLAQFDRHYDLGRLETWFHLDGERALYWVGSAAIFLAAVLLALRVRETPPPGNIRQETFSLVRFFRDVFGRRQQWMVYLLYICPFFVIAGIGTFVASAYGAFVTLFQTEQLGFTRQQIGWMAGTIGIVNMLLFVPAWGYLADRLSRLKMFRFALLAPVVVNLGLFLTVRYVTHYSLPYSVMIGFAIVNEGLMSMIYVLWGPLVYDYLPSNAYGTAHAGFSCVGGLTNFLLINGAGLWVKGFTDLFGTVGQSRYDYSCVFLWQAASAAVACFIAFYFAREVKLGRIIAHARQEFAEKPEPAADGIA